MPKQTCPVCLQEFFAPPDKGKKYCTVRCRNREKARRSRETDEQTRALAQRDYHEVINNPTAGQVAAIALFMLNGGTRKASYFTNVKFVFKAPPGLDWITPEPGQAILAHHVRDIMDEWRDAQARGEAVVLAEAPKGESAAAPQTTEEKLASLMEKIHGAAKPQASQPILAPEPQALSREAMEAELAEMEAPREGSEE